MNREDIAEELCKVSHVDALKDWNRVKRLSSDELGNLNGRSRIGCKVINRYFFKDRLATKGKKGINFFEFVRDYDTIYSKKHYIQTLIRFCDKNGRYKNSLYRRLWYCYGLCFGRISAFKITNALVLYDEFRPTHVLDPFAGFGGRMAGAMLRGIDYTGYDTNTDLMTGYEQMKRELSETSSGTHTIVNRSAEDIDFRKISPYDMVLTSPPYDNIEAYPHQPYRTEEEWDGLYGRVLSTVWAHLSKQGVLVINISSAIYERALVPALGSAHEERILKKSSRNPYQEMVYIWKKD